MSIAEERGIEIEMKMSGTGNKIPALARTDQFLTNLADHEDPEIQALAAARLGLKSTIAETRTERLLAVARLNWDAVQ